MDMEDGQPSDSKSSFSCRIFITNDLFKLPIMSLLHPLRLLVSLLRSISVFNASLGRRYSKELFLQKRYLKEHIDPVKDSCPQWYAYSFSGSKRGADTIPLAAKSCTSAIWALTGADQGGLDVLRASALVGGGLDFRLLLNRTLSLFLPLLCRYSVCLSMMSYLTLYPCTIICLFLLNTEDKDNIVRYIKSIDTRLLH